MPNIILYTTNIVRLNFFRKIKKYLIVIYEKKNERKIDIILKLLISKTLFE